MSRRIFKNRESVSSSPFQFQTSSPDGLGNLSDALEAEAELEAFDQTARPAPTPLRAPGTRTELDIQAMIEQAQADSDAILADARSKAAEIEGEAYEKGLIEGRKTGEIMAEQQLQAVLTLYQNALDKLDKIRDLTLNQLQIDIMELILYTAEKVVKTELQTNPQAILHMVRDAIRVLKERKDLGVFLNQEDHQFVVGLAESQRQTWLGTQVNLEVDPGLSRGSFRIETPAGELDALIQTQFEQIKEELKKVTAPQ